MGFPDSSVAKELPAVQETTVRFPGWEDPLEEGTAIRSSILENGTERGAWQATVHWVTKSLTQLERHSTNYL